MADLASVASLLKEMYPSTFETAFSNEIVGISRLERTSEGIVSTINGRYIHIPIHTGRNQGIGSRAERAILPAPGEQTTDAVQVTIAHQYAVGEITAQALRLADTNAKSFVAALDMEISGLRNDAMKDYARQFYGDGTGTLSAVDGAPAANVVTVDEILYFEEDMVLDVIDDSTGAVNALAVTVESVDRDNNQITVNDDTGITDNDLLVRTGSYNQEINGLRNLLDVNHATVAYQNRTSTQQSKWRPIIVAPGAHTWSEIRVGKILDDNRRDTGKPTTAIFTGQGVVRAMYATVDDDRRYSNTLEFGVGFSALPLVWKGRTYPVIDDPDFPEDIDASTGEMFGIHEPTLKIYREEAWHFAEETGSMFIPDPDRRDQVEFRMRQFSQLGSSQRNNHWRLQNITIPAA